MAGEPIKKVTVEIKKLNSQLLHQILKSGRFSIKIYFRSNSILDYIIGIKIPTIFGGTAYLDFT